MPVAAESLQRGQQEEAALGAEQQALQNQITALNQEMEKIR